MPQEVIVSKLIVIRNREEGPDRGMQKKYEN
jgi:hypothetical protein